MENNIRRQPLWVLLGLVLVVAAGCGHTTSQPIAPAPATTAGHPAAGFAQLPPATTSSRLNVPACTLLTHADVAAVALTFTNSTTTITVDDQGRPGTEQGVNSCSYQEQGSFTEPDGIRSSLESGAAASLTIIAGGADYAFQRGAGDTLHGLGDEAYWAAGTNEVVVRKGNDVLKVVDDVPVDGTRYSDLKVPYEKAAEDLAARILADIGR